MVPHIPYGKHCLAQWLWANEGEEVTGNALSRQRVRTTYLERMTDDVAAVLFDTRRRTAHSLVLNFWVACGGLQSFLNHFHSALEQLWAAVDAEAAAKSMRGAQGEGQSGLGLLWAAAEDVEGRIPAASAAASAEGCMTSGVCQWMHGIMHDAFQIGLSWNVYGHL